MTLSSSARSKLLRFALTCLFVTGGLFVALVNAKPTLRFPPDNTGSWIVAPNQEYIIGNGSRSNFVSRRYLITQESEFLLLSEVEVQSRYIFISPDSRLIALAHAQQIDFFSAVGHLLKQVDLSDTITHIDHAAWAPDSLSLMVVGSFYYDCGQSLQCHTIKLLYVYFPNGHVELIDAPMCNIPGQPECLQSNGESRVYWRIDGKAFYLAAGNTADYQQYWYRVPLDSPEQIQFYYSAGNYIYHTYQYFPEEVFAGDWNMPRNPDFNRSLPVQIQTNREIDYGYGIKIEGNDLGVFAGLFVIVMALFFGLLRPSHSSLKD